MPQKILLYQNISMIISERQRSYKVLSTTVKICKDVATKNSKSA